MKFSLLCTIVTVLLVTTNLVDAVMPPMHRAKRHLVDAKHHDAQEYAAGGTAHSHTHHLFSAGEGHPKEQAERKLKHHDTHHHQATGTKKHADSFNEHFARMLSGPGSAEHSGAKHHHHHIEMEDTAPNKMGTMDLGNHRGMQHAARHVNPRNLAESKHYQAQDYLEKKRAHYAKTREQKARDLGHGAEQHTTKSYLRASNKTPKTKSDVSQILAVHRLIASLTPTPL
jgi:hypothetical protein